MDPRWREPLVKARRYVWLAELVLLLVVLLVYKFTEAQWALATVFISIMLVSLPLSMLTLAIDEIDVNDFGKDDGTRPDAGDFYDAS